MPLTSVEPERGIAHGLAETAWPHDFHNSFYLSMADTNPRDFLLAVCRAGIPPLLQGPARLRAAELEECCLRLRRQGLSHRAIAAQLGIALSPAHKRVRHAFNEINRRNGESATELRAFEAARLDELQNAIWERATEGEARRWMPCCASWSGGRSRWGSVHGCSTSRTSRWRRRAIANALHLSLEAAITPDCLSP